MEIRGIAALFFALLPINREFVIASMTSSVEYSADYSGISTDDRSIAIRKPANQLAIRFSRYRSPHSIVSFFFYSHEKCNFHLPPPQPFLIPVEDRYVQLRWLEGNSDFSGSVFFEGKEESVLKL